MTERNPDATKPATGEQRPASPDSLVKNDKTRGTVLSEEELKDVTGGTGGAGAGKAKF